jgi:polyferredoxin
MTSGGGNWRPSGMPGMGTAFRVVQARPSGPGRIALLVFLIILALPLLALAIVAGLVSMAVFLVLAGWNRLFKRATPDWASHDSEGRKGVRVKR